MAQISSPIAGFIAKINVQAGDQINKGDIVAILQCMKTEISVVADTDGIVSEIKGQEGDEINLGDAIVVLT